MKKLKDLIKQFGIKSGDLVVALMLLLLSAAMGGIILIFSPVPNYAVITVNGSEICQLPLDRDCTYQIGKTNTIKISDGTVRMIEADCPDKICMHTGSISNRGQAIVCLPNKVVISISGGDSSTDAYTN